MDQSLQARPYERWQFTTARFHKQLLLALSNAQREQNDVAETAIRRKGNQFQQFVRLKNAEIENAFNVQNIDGAEDAIYDGLKTLYDYANQQPRTSLPGLPERQRQRADVGASSGPPQFSDDQRSTMAAKHIKWKLVMEQHERRLLRSLAKARQQQNRFDLMTLGRKLADYRDLIVPLSNRIQLAIGKRDFDLAESLIFDALKIINDIGEIDGGDKIPIVEMESFDPDKKRFSGAQISLQGPKTILSQVMLQTDPSEPIFKYSQRSKEPLHLPKY